VNRPRCARRGLHCELSNYNAEPQAERNRFYEKGTVFGVRCPCRGLTTFHFVKARTDGRFQTLVEGVGAGSTDRENAISLIAELLINYVHQWLTLLESFELRDEELHGLVQPIGGVVGTMRGHQYSFQLVEGMAVG